MSYYFRLQKSFEGALRLPLNPCSKYVLFSDCHRGSGTSNDNFLKNQNLYYAALQHYFIFGYTYIELGDGDELWENRSTYPHCCGNSPHLNNRPLWPEIRFYPGIILENTASPGAGDIYLTHGHQADLFTSTLWRFTRFLVRYLWKPLEHYGVLDPTSAAKNYTQKQTTEKRLQTFARKEHIILITGHTHRPTLSEKELYYCNSGSCVHPYSITCLEIEHVSITLVKWILAVKPDNTLYVTREVLSGPFPISARP